MAQQGTSGTPPERRYDDTMDPHNPPRAVLNPRVRRKALLVYLGGIVLLFAVVAVTFMVWPGAEREVTRIDTAEPQPVGTSGERLPGGFRPGGTPDSTADELERRGVGSSIGGPMPHLVMRPTMTSLRDIAAGSAADVAHRRVELADVEVDAIQGDTVWLRDGDVRMAAVVNGVVAAVHGSRVDVGGYVDEGPDGTTLIRATRVDVRTQS